MSLEGGRGRYKWGTREHRVERTGERRELRKN